jgi:two-component system response regulator BaeR
MKNAYSDHRIVSDRTMDSHITKLRKKLLPLTDKEIISSVYGAGYKFQFNEK